MITKITVIFPGRINQVAENVVELECEIGPTPINDKWHDETTKQLGPDKANQLYDELVDEATERFIQRLIRFKPRD